MENRKSMSRLVLLICLFLMFISRVQADMTISGSTAATNHRFANDAKFLTGTTYAGQDFSGVGQASNSRWATLISSNVAITAHHFTPTGSLNFYSGNDATVSPVERNIESTFRIPGTDFRLILLDEHVPESISYYSFATQQIDGTAALPNIYDGDTTLMVGRSATTVFSSGDHRQAFGQNRIDGYSENVTFNGADNDFFILANNPVADTTSTGSPFVSTYDDSSVLYESLVQGGDSGAPFFTLDEDGELLLLGVNSVRFSFFEDENMNGTRDTGETFYGNASGPSYIGNTSSTIQNFIQVNAVPEPSAVSVLAIITVGMFVRRRRRTVIIV
jgi:hypothetical protein